MHTPPSVPTMPQLNESHELARPLCAKFWLRFCLSALVLLIFQSPIHCLAKDLSIIFALLISVPLPTIQSETWLVHAKVREPHLNPPVRMNFLPLALV